MADGGAPAIEFRAEDHTYWLGKERIWNVTSILQVLGGYENIPEEILKKAADRGQRVHRATEQLDLGTIDYGAVEEDVAPYLTAWECFKEDFKPEILAVEKRLYHPVRRYAGTMDRELVIKGVRGVLDIKSTWKLMPATGAQTAAYMEAVNHGRKAGDKARKRWGLRLKKDYSTVPYELKEYKDVNDLNVFNSCHVIHKWKIANEQPKH